MRNIDIKDIVNTMDNADSFSIFFVGDSITEGARASSDETTYVAYVAEGLAKKYENKRVVRYDGKRHPTTDGALLPLLKYDGPIEIQRGNNGILSVIRSGIGGNTVQRLLNRKTDFIGKEIGGRTADLFIINVGINDALKCDPCKYVTSETFADNLNALIDEIEKGAPNADIILMTPSYNDTGDSNISNLDPYANKMRSIAKERQIPLIDLHKAWMDHLVIGTENYGQQDWLSGVAGDSCHPSDIGHKAIAQTILDCLK